jgi:hemolysin activation/secretion protein
MRERRGSLILLGSLIFFSQAALGSSPVFEFEEPVSYIPNIEMKRERFLPLITSSYSSNLWRRTQSSGYEEINMRLGNRLPGTFLGSLTLLSGQMFGAPFSPLDFNDPFPQALSVAMKRGDPLEDDYLQKSRGLRSVRLKGLALVPSKEGMLEDKVLKDVEGLYVSNVALPGSFEKLEKILTPLYLDQPLDLEKITEIKNAIYDFYEKNDEPFILIVIPSQNISYKVLQLIVIPAKVGKIRVEGNRYFSDKAITKYVGAKPGELIDLYAIERDLDVINRNPFRRVNMVYGPGQEFGTTDLTFMVQDRRPYRFYAGVDNTGVETTGRQRFFGGVTLGNFLWLDHLFTYQYTSSYDIHSFQGHTGQYIAPLSWGHLLNLYGGYSTVNPHMPFPSIRHHGENGQASLRYVIPLKAAPRALQEFTLGFDFKNTNNTIAFSELVLNFGRSVNLSQFMIEYKSQQEGKAARFDFDLQLFCSPGPLFPNQTNVDFSSLRRGAKNRWFYGKGSMRYFQNLPKEFSMTLWLQGQYASASLLPSEQFGIGGYATVRGYDERQLNMDNAFLSSLELRSPRIPVVSMLRSSPAKDGLQFLAFIDYGWGSNRTSLAGEPSPEYLLGAGPGIRYTLDPYLAARLDWGIKLHKKEIFTGGDSEVHFSVTLSY